MKYTVSIIGGGSLYTLPLLHTVCTAGSKFSVSKVIMYDTDLPRQKLRYEAAKIMLRELSPETELVVADSLEEAVSNVDYVLIQIRTGGLDMRISDERTPLLYGCVGQETCGAGGLMYGMRSIKDTLEIVKTARRHSPQSWIINFSNPASLLAEATRRYFDKDERLVYLCDMTLLMQDAFESMLKLPKGELRPRYFGLNHFGWFTHLYDCDGNDRVEELRQKLLEGDAVPDELKNDADWRGTFKRLGKMLRAFGGYIPSTYLQYYYYPNELLRCSDPENTRAKTVKEVKQKKVDALCNAIIKNDTAVGCGIESGAHGKYIMDFILATLQPNENREFLIPVKNDGAISNISAEATVEIPCVVSCDGVKKLFVGEVESFYKGLIENQYACERLTVDGVLENDVIKCLEGFTLNRMINDADTARNLLRDMLEQNQKWLPELYEHSRRMR